MGAEIPDTIQSVTVARRGYGSMAVSNSTGSQIINILIGPSAGTSDVWRWLGAKATLAADPDCRLFSAGLGVPWLTTNASGRDIQIRSVRTLQLMTNFQFGCVATYLALLLLPTIPTWRPGDHSKAVLNRLKAKIMLLVYGTVLAVCAPLLLQRATVRVDANRL